MTRRHSETLNKDSGVIKRKVGHRVIYQPTMLVGLRKALLAETNIMTGDLGSHINSTVHEAEERGRMGQWRS